MILQERRKHCLKDFFLRQIETSKPTLVSLERKRKSPAVHFRKEGRVVFILFLILFRPPPRLCMRIRTSLSGRKEGERRVLLVSSSIHFKPFPFSIIPFLFSACFSLLLLLHYTPTHPSFLSRPYTVCEHRAVGRIKRNRKGSHTYDAYEFNLKQNIINVLLFLLITYVLF